MSRGIQLKQLSASNLHYLGLPADLLSATPAERAGDRIGAGQGSGGGPDLWELAALDAALTAVARQSRRGASADAELRALIQEVGTCLESVLSLLTEALPASSRPSARRPQAHYGAVRQPHAPYAPRVARDLACAAERQVPNAIRVR